MTKHYLNKGERAYRKKDYKGAVAIFSKAISSAGKAMTVEQIAKKALTMDDTSLKYEPKRTHAQIQLHHFRSRALAELKMSSKAFLDLQECLRLFPQFAPALSDRGVHYLRQNKFAHAMKDFSNAIKIDPNFIEAYKNRAELKKLLGRNEASIVDSNIAKRLSIERKKKPKTVEDELQKVHQYYFYLWNLSVKYHPKSAKLYNKRGVNYARIGDKYKAIKDFNRAIKLDPNYAYAYFNRAKRYFDLKQYKKSFQDYTTVIRKKPKWWVAYAQRGVAYARLKKWDKSIKDISTRVKLNPDAESYFERAKVYFASNQKLKAISDCNSAINKRKNYLDAIVLRSAARTALGQYTLCVQDANKAIALDPKCAVAYNNRGYAYYCLGDLKKAQVDLDKAIRLDPNSEDALANRAKIFAKTGQLEQASIDSAIASNIVREKNREEIRISPKDLQFELDRYNKLLKLAPDNSRTFYSRGMVNLCLGKNKEATKDFLEFLYSSKWRGDSASYAVVLASLSMKQSGRIKDSKYIFKEALRNMPRERFTPELNYFAGKISKEVMLSQAKDHTALTRSKCLLGLSYVIDKKYKQAKSELTWVKLKGDTRIEEYKLALAELNRLKNSSVK